jgi:hypothetical protein
MKGKHLLPLLMLAVFVVSRIPGLMPVNFSAAYALAFCAGLYFPGAMAWWVPLCVMLATDLGINGWYALHGVPDAFNPASMLYMLGNYVGYVVLIWLGRRFKARDSWWWLLSGGVFGALVFYLVTNTLSWLFDPGYVKTIAGWIQALTTGLPGFPSTWTFFLNTLLSGGLFTGLFVGAMKLSTAESPQEKGEQAETEDEPQPEEAKA